MRTYRTALVTGASSGIGAGLVRRLAAHGTHVVACARRERELGEIVVAVTHDGGRAEARVLDVADADATARAVREIDAHVGGLDLIVANAGVGEPDHTRPSSWEGLAQMIRVNFDGAIATLTAVLPAMLERRRGHLVGISSMAGRIALPGSAAYCATKAGLSMFLQSLRMDLVGTGVAATVVHPGFVKTPMTARNRFPMPFLMDLESALDLLLRELPRAPATIDFPRPMDLVVRIAGAVPRSLRERILRSRRP